MARTINIRPEQSTPFSGPTADHVTYSLSLPSACILLLAFFVLFLQSTYSNSQTYTLKGRVTDKNSGEPLAFVNVVYGKGNLGTTTNIDGWFTITANAPEITLTFLYIGYEKYSETIVFPFSGTYNAKLKRAVYDLNEVNVFPGENPANGIMRKVIDNKDRHNPENLPAFSYLSYSRLHFTLEIDNPVEFRADTISISTQQYQRLNQKKQKEVFRSFLNKQHLFLMETVSKRQYNGPGKNKETVIASKTSGLQQPYIFLLANQFQSFTLYGEEFELGTRKYVSPVCNACTGKYLFIIEDTLLQETNDTLFIISFRPSHGKNFNGMTGILHINSNGYAVESIQAEPTERDTAMNISIQQKYRRMDGGAWFPVELNTRLSLNNMSGVLLDTIPLSDSTAVKVKQRFVFAGIGKSYLDSVSLTPDLSDVRFNHVEISMDKKAILNDPSYFEPYRPDSLSDKDMNTYHFIDSIGKEINLDNKIRILTYMMTGNIPYHFIDFDLYRFIAYNRFEGLRAGCGLKTNDKMLSWFSVGGWFAYGFSDEEFKYGYSARLKQPSPKEAYIEYQSNYDTHEPGKSAFQPRRNLNNTEIFRLLLLDAMDYETSQTVTLHTRMLRYVTTDVVFSDHNIQPSPAFTTVNNGYDPDDTFLYRQAALSFRFLYREKFSETLFGRMTLGSDFPEVNGFLAYIETANGLTAIKSELKTTARINFHFAGTSNIILRGGYISGEVPLFLSFNGNGSYAPFSLDASGTFQTMLPYEFFSNRFASVFIRHQFGHLLFKTGSFKPGIELIHNMGISSPVTGNHNATVHDFSKGYFESGIIVSNLLKVNFSGLGIGVFYRYGPYAHTLTEKNICLKISFSFTP